MEIGLACKEPQKDTNVSTEDRHPEKQMEDFVDKSSKGNLDENGRKVHQYSSLERTLLKKVRKVLRKTGVKSMKIQTLRVSVVILAVLFLVKRNQMVKRRD